MRTERVSGKVRSRGGACGEEPARMRRAAPPCVYGGAAPAGVRGPGLRKQCTSPVKVTAGHFVYSRASACP